MAPLRPVHHISLKRAVAVLLIVDSALAVAAVGLLLVRLPMAQGPAAIPAPVDPTASVLPTASPAPRPQAMSSTTLEPSPGPDPTTYTVQPGDTLLGIAERFGVEYTAIAAANGITNANAIQAGQTLAIPATTAHPGPTSTGLLPSTASAPWPAYEILGFSTLGWAIESYRIGDGPVRIAFIGGIHGGYEWNTILLAYRAVDHFGAHPEEVPDSVSLYIIPAANPDGLVALIGHAGPFSPDEVPPDTTSGRFNGNRVDLNRNWDCRWAPTGVWRQQEVSAGTEPFSEAETRVLRDALIDPPVDAALFWHSAVPGVFPGGCAGRFPEAERLATVYADASGYPFQATFTSYAVTGDATDWLSTRSIPAVSIELADHAHIDWDQNLAGIRAVMRHYQAADAGPEALRPARLSSAHLDLARS